MTLMKPFHTSQAPADRVKIASILNASHLTLIWSSPIKIGRGNKYFATELYYILA